MLAPLRGFWDTQSEVDRMFNDMVRGVLGRRLTESPSCTWSPQLEAYAKDGDSVLHYHLPGVGLEDVDIALDGNVLTISGERKVTTEEGIEYYLNELPYGSFRRHVTVPEGIDADSIKAHFEGGGQRSTWWARRTRAYPTRCRWGHASCLPRTARDTLSPGSR